MTESIKAILVGLPAEAAERLKNEIAGLVDFGASCGGPASAYAAVRRDRPDAVFLDTAENRREGLGFCRWLRSAYPEVLVFMVSPVKDPDLFLEGFRSGATDFLLVSGNGTEGEIRAAVQRALGKAENLSRTGKTIGFFSAGGGQGVTTAAVNTADQLRQLTGERVLLLDLNLYVGGVNALLADLPAYSVFDCARDLDRLDASLLFSSLLPHRRGFHVLTVPMEVGDADRVAGPDVERMLRVLSGYFSFIVVDLPHDFSPRTLAAIEAADLLLCLADPRVPRLKSLRQALAFFDELGYEPDRVRIVVNEATGGVDFTESDIGAAFDRPVFARIRHDRKRFSESVDKEALLAEVRPTGGAASDFARLAGRISGAQEPAGAGGILRRLLKGRFGGTAEP
jgi:pilus assembly protein CpaE